MRCSVGRSPDCGGSAVGALHGHNPPGAPTFSPGTLAVFEDKARIDLEIRRRETRVLQPWQGLVLVALVVVVLVAWLR